MNEPPNSYRALESRSCDWIQVYDERLGAHRVGVPNRAQLARALQERGRAGRKALVDFEIWMICGLGYAPSTARRKLRLVWGALCDHPGEPWAKVSAGHAGQNCLVAKSWSYLSDLRRALKDFAEWIVEHIDDSASGRDLAHGILEHLGFDLAEIEARIALREAVARRKDMR